MTNQISKTEIMKAAWVLARKGAKRFGGKPSQYIAAALRQTWELAKAQPTVKQVAKAFDSMIPTTNRDFRDAWTAPQRWKLAQIFTSTPSAFTDLVDFLDDAKTGKVWVSKTYASKLIGAYV